MATGDPTGPQTNGSLVDQIKNPLQVSFSSYVQKLRSPDQGANKTDDGEGFNTVRLADPFRTRPEQPGDPLVGITLPRAIMLHPVEDLTKIRTSWDSTKNGKGLVGRSGYSVKFVPFKTLRGESQGISTDGQGTPLSNTIPMGLDDTEGDIAVLPH
jgi:hypothetical protein